MRCDVENFWTKPIHYGVHHQVLRTFIFPLFNFMKLVRPLVSCSEETTGP